ncbi:MAG: hypothetical protein Q8L92_01490, partial [Rubrivivax sp.]|nr:hypothetical protein [Rubrivivax sp.]
MSIIEKAAGKIGSGSPASPGAPRDDHGGRDDASLIENALNKQRNAGHAAPFVATPVEPMFSAQEAESVLEGNSQIQSINLARLHRMGVVSP